MVLESDGANSVLNVAALTSFTETGGFTYSTLQASSGGTVNDSSLAGLSGVNRPPTGPPRSPPSISPRYRRVDRIGGMAASRPDDIQLRQHHRQRRCDGEAADGDEPPGRRPTTLEATGPGSSLTLAVLATITQATNNYGAETPLRGPGRRHGDLPALQDHQHRHGGPRGRRPHQRPERAGLDRFTEANGWTSSTLQASNGGTVNDGSLASLSTVIVTVAGRASISRWGALTSFNNGNITVSGGATLSLPGVTSYTGSGGRPRWRRPARVAH